MLNSNSASNSNSSCNENYNISDDFLDREISVDEVYNVIRVAKCGKAPGYDEIPVEVYKNQTALCALTRIFNVCFSTGKVPDVWSRGIITPIPKSSTSDVRDPLAFRGITLAPSSYKIYCGILNSRLTKSLDDFDILHDEQNGFRTNRSTLDHLSTITSIIECRKIRKLSTFAAFIDFKKAYDTINRNLLFCKLQEIGISCKMLNAIKSLIIMSSHVLRLTVLLHNGSMLTVD